MLNGATLEPTALVTQQQGATSFLSCTATPYLATVTPAANRAVADNTTTTAQLALGTEAHAMLSSSSAGNGAPAPLVIADEHTTSAAQASMNSIAEPVLVHAGAADTTDTVDSTRAHNNINAINTLELTHRTLISHYSLLQNGSISNSRRGSGARTNNPSSSGAKLTRTLIRESVQKAKEALHAGTLLTPETLHMFRDPDLAEATGDENVLVLPLGMYARVVQDRLIDTEAEQEELLVVDGPGQNYGGVAASVEGNAAFEASTVTSGLVAELGK